MRLTHFLLMGKRCPRKKLDSNTRRHWRQKGSFLDVDRLCVPDQVLTNAKTNPLVRADNMFHHDGYDKALIEEIEIGLAPGQALQLEQLKTDRLAKFRRDWQDPRVHHPTDNGSSDVCLTYSNKRRFSKGLDQASVLTNTFVFAQTPPPRVNNLVDRIVDTCYSQSAPTDWMAALTFSIERSILHAHRWHSDETRLPRRFQADLPIWKHKTEFGIHPDKTTRFLFQNLFRLMEFQVPNFIKFAHLTERSQHHETTSSRLPGRWTTFDRFLETHYFYDNNNNVDANSSRRINFAELHDVAIWGSKPIEPSIADWNEVESVCAERSLPTKSLGPMSALVDLVSTRYFRDESVDGWLDGGKTRIYPHSHLFTINLSLPNMWSDFLEPEADPVKSDQRQASALMHCYAAAIAQARSLNLVQSSTDNRLSKPLSVQAICSDGVYFDFVTLQLNTLDVPNASSTSLVKNFAWIDGHHKLFHKAVPKRSMLRNTKFEDLNINVFCRLASYYMWGVVDHVNL